MANPVEPHRWYDYSFTVLVGIVVGAVVGVLVLDVVSDQSRGSGFKSTVLIDVDVQSNTSFSVTRVDVPQSVQFLAYPPGLLEALPPPSDADYRIVYWIATYGGRDPLRTYGGERLQFQELIDLAQSASISPMEWGLDRNAALRKQVRDAISPVVSPAAGFLDCSMFDTVASLSWRRGWSAIRISAVICTLTTASLGGVIAFGLAHRSLSARARRYGRSVCRCGYSLDGLAVDARCPECGAAAERNDGGPVAGARG